MYFNKAVRQDCLEVDSRGWSRPEPVRHSFASPNKGNSYLPPHWQSPCCPAVARPQARREYGPVPGELRWMTPSRFRNKSMSEMLGRADTLCPTTLVRYVP